MKNSVWISAEHIPGCKHIAADFMLRHWNDNVEGQLCKSIFKELITKFKFFPEIDLSVSQINKQLDKYVS